MTAVLLNIFITGLDVSGRFRFLLLLPLCLSIAIVYKTTRCQDVRKVPGASLVLFVSIVIGMYVVGVGLWALFSIMA